MPKQKPVLTPAIVDLAMKYSEYRDCWANILDDALEGLEEKKDELETDLEARNEKVSELADELKEARRVRDDTKRELAEVTKAQKTLEPFS